MDKALTHARYMKPYAQGAIGLGLLMLVIGGVALVDGMVRKGGISVLGAWFFGVGLATLTGGWGLLRRS